MDVCDMASSYELLDQHIRLLAHEHRPKSTKFVEDAQGNRLCEDCGEVIPLKRVRALPEATRCVKCQEYHEG